MGVQLSASDKEGIRKEAAARLQGWRDQDGFLESGVLDGLTVGRMRRIWTDRAGITKEHEDLDMKFPAGRSDPWTDSRVACSRWRSGGESVDTMNGGISATGAMNERNDSIVI